MYDLDGNPKDRFTRDMDQMIRLNDDIQGK